MTRLLQSPSVPPLSSGHVLPLSTRQRPVWTGIKSSHRQRANRAMKVLVLEKPGTLVWSRVNRPTPAAGEALVRVRRCGVGRTDIAALAGRQPAFTYPLRLGRELCVEVVSAPGQALQAGDLCAVEGYLPCGVCRACRASTPNGCRDLRVLGVHVDGGHAPLLALPVDKLHHSPSLSPDQLALVEMVVVGAQAVDRAGLASGEPTLVIGLGLTGLAAAIFAKSCGANLACLDVRPDRLAFACDWMRLGRGFSPSGTLTQDLRKHFGQPPSVVIDATGNVSTMQRTFHLAAPHGRTVFLGSFAGDLIFHDPTVHGPKPTPAAGRAGLAEMFREVIRRMENLEVDAEACITHRFGFGEAPERLAALHREPGLVKAMIDFDGFAET